MRQRDKTVKTYNEIVASMKSRLPVNMQDGEVVNALLTVIATEMVEQQIAMEAHLQMLFEEISPRPVMPRDLFINQEDLNRPQTSAAPNRIATAPWGHKGTT